MEILLIRHGMTEGNKAGKYIGATDEPLFDGCSDMAGILAAVSGNTAGYSDTLRVYVSPMRRCVETAKLIFPFARQIVLDDLRECDFGEFEGKTNAELVENPAYIRWIDSAGRETPPGGEAAVRFRGRCTAAFLRAVDESMEQRAERAAFVTHGGVIMAILERFSGDIGKPRGFYEWQVKNGEGFSARADGEAWASGRILRDIKRL